MYGRVRSIAPHAIRVQDRGIGRRLALLEPAQKRRSEVEADRRVVVDDLDDPIVRVENTRRSIGLVALGGDPLVPVVIRMRGILSLDRFQPRVLARRLIEVTVNTDEANAHPADYRCRVPRLRLPR